MDVRFAGPRDGARLRAFIERWWQPGHVLGHSRRLLDWQYWDRRRARYNFLLAEEGHEMRAILGFIPMTQCDPAIELTRLCWLAIWQIDERFKGQRLGRLLLDQFWEQVNPRILGANAITAEATHVYLSRGYRIARLDHHFVVNREMADYRLLVDGGSPDEPRLGWTSRRLVDVTINEAESARFDAMAWEQIEAQNTMPAKTPAYLRNRYLRHPFYDYRMMRIVEHDATIGLLVLRTCEHDGARALRLVDFVGPEDSLLGLAHEWRRLLGGTHAEYLDFYSGGIGLEVLAASGMRRRVDGDGFVVPNWFEPFERRNIDIDCMTSVATPPGWRTMKADSDQDRPSMLPLDDPELDFEADHLARA